MVRFERIFACLLKLYAGIDRSHNSALVVDLSAAYKNWSSLIFFFFPPSTFLPAGNPTLISAILNGRHNQKKRKMSAHHDLDPVADATLYLAHDNPRPINDQAARLLLYAVPKPITSLLTMAAPHATAPVGDVNVNLPETRYHISAVVVNHM
ncbi:hypothetical protein PCANC_09534 [Puccinia coronata f. sp. avenae]|uniref:Uncharacterized protein n=1 Tax=Puccinia coronata f. sp. avenae TaxID=200324 RepID=A0A2N5V501_9BASI|nr:hypothetical protein PCANC_09534 [Puccinia coronata f. sp. avenae]